MRERKEQHPGASGQRAKRSYDVMENESKDVPSEASNTSSSTMPISILPGDSDSDAPSSKRQKTDPADAAAVVTSATPTPPV